LDLQFLQFTQWNFSFFKPDDISKSRIFLSRTKKFKLATKERNWASTVHKLNQGTNRADQRKSVDPKAEELLNDIFAKVSSASCWPVTIRYPILAYPGFGYHMQQVEDDEIRKEVFRVLKEELQQLNIELQQTYQPENCEKGIAYDGFWELCFWELCFSAPRSEASQTLKKKEPKKSCCPEGDCSTCSTRCSKYH
jgi:hypothetical protein